MWEYRVETVRVYGKNGDVTTSSPPSQQETFLIASLGEQGWELVSVVAVTDGNLRLYFKRRRG